MKKLLLSTLAIATIAVGCSKNNEELINSPVLPDYNAPISLNAGITANSESRAAVEGANFTENTENVFRLAAFSGSAAPTAFDVNYFSDQQVDSKTSSVVALKTTQYYPADNTKKLYFYAWAPVATTLTPGTDVDAPVANYTITGQEDIMAAQNTTGIAKVIPQTNPSFTFTHKLKQVKFKIVAGQDFPTGIKVTDITVKGVKTSAKLDIITGALTFDATTGDISLPITSGKDAITTDGTEMDGSLMFEAGTTFTLSVTAGGVTYNDIAITLTGSNAGKASISHLVTLTFKPTAITSTADITVWTSGAGASADIQ